MATYIDGYYIASSVSNQYGFNNLERIEVLKGPQGTLFGRNATGGVIQLVTKDPTEDVHGNFEIGYGNYQAVDANAYLTGGLAKNLAADVAIQYHDQGKGFGRNITTGNDLYKDETIAVRSKFVYTGESTKVSLFLNYEKLTSDGLVLQFAPATRAIYGYPDTGRFDIQNQVDPYQRARKKFVGLRIEQDLGFAKLVSSSFYAKYDQEYGQNYDALTPANNGGGYATDASTQFSQEIQLIGADTSRFQWQVGGYLFKFKSDTILSLNGPFFAPNPSLYSTGKTSSVAVYGQATYEIVDNLKLTGGLRYTFDKYRTENAHIAIPSFGLDLPSPDRRRTANKPTWRLSLDYQATPDVLAYVSYNRGVKSGGFSAYSQASAGYNPEQLDAYEAGLKSQLFNRALRLNFSGFYYDYKDLQVNIIDPCGCSSQIRNAATARVYGLDVDFEIAPVKNFTLSGGFGLLDAKYKDFPGSPSTLPDGSATVINAGGNRMINSPKFSGSATAAYVMPTEAGDFRASATVTNKGLTYTAPDNIPVLPGYTLLNASLGWTSTDERYGVELWALNLTDKNYYVQMTPVSVPFGYVQMAGPPRTYGVRLKAKF